MHLIQSPTGLSRSPSHDGAELQRQLMQDLERQWLESWVVADQQQAESLRNPQAADVSPPTPDVGEVAVPPACITLSTPDATSSRTSAENTVSVAPSIHQMRGRDLQALDSGFPMQAAPWFLQAPPPMSELRPGVAQATSALRAPQAYAHAPVPHKHHPTRASVPPHEPFDPLARRARLPPPLPSSLGSQRNEAVALPSPRDSTPRQPELGATAPRWHAPNAIAGTRALIPAMQASALFPLSGNGSTLTQVMSPTSSARATYAVNVAPAPIALVKSAPNTAPPKDHAPGTRHPMHAREDDVHRSPRNLMLREVGEQEVRASLRDTGLNGSSSASAAQALSHALLQAGYGRAHVVVNGQQHRSELQTRNDAGQVDSRSTARPLSQPYTLQECRRGY